VALHGGFKSWRLKVKVLNKELWVANKQRSSGLVVGWSVRNSNSLP